MSFDFEQWGKTGFNLDNLGVQFGVPNCLMDISKAALELLPSPQLGSVNKKLTEGLVSANERISLLKKQIASRLGIFEIDTFTGKFVLSTGFATGSNDNKLSDFIATAQEFVSQGYNLYQNVAAPVNQILDILHCINSVSEFNDLQDTGIKGTSRLIAETVVPQVQDAQNFINKAKSQIQNINTILQIRRLDPSKEPIYNTSAGIVTGDDLLRAQELANLFVSSTEDTSPIFDLIYGPPISKNGQYILSIDGLYYDSQSGGLPEVSGVILPENRWKFEYNPNLGGKGQAISLRDLDQYADTIFDLDKIDDSKDLQVHYDSDNFLQVLIGEKNKQIYDLSSHINQFIASGYSNSDAIVVNLVQSLYSTASRHQIKINKRKKQIEIAIRIPQLYGADLTFSAGSVPINDFSYLASSNFAVALEKQKKLIFERAEVSSLVLPLHPKFVVAQKSSFAPVITPLLVPAVDAGGIIYNLSGRTDSSGAFTVSLTDEIVTDDLIAVYNFLNSKIVSPGSTEYPVINSKVIPEGNSLKQNAQIVSDSTANVFTSGLAIPYLRGMCKHSTNTLGQISAIGSVVLLPQTNEYQNLTYNPKGFTLETWVFAPTMFNNGGEGWATGTNASSLHRVILGCENIGGTSINANPNNTLLDFNSNSVRGMLFGFTRDKMLLSGTPNSNISSDAVAFTAASIYLAPTVSVNASDVTFISNNDDNCMFASGYRCMSYPMKSHAQLSAIDSQFIHIVLSVAPSSNSISIYADSVLVATSSITSIFGVPVNSPIQLPSFAASNSFEYTTDSTGNTLFANGPKKGQYFTPWVVGSGWTDGLRFYNGSFAHNFMGGISGISSGLKGFIGSLKFYSRALSSTEIAKNYNAQKGFFKNIKTQ